MGAGGQSEIVDGAGGGDGFVECWEGARFPALGDFEGAVVIEVEDTGDREVRETIGGEVGVVHDAAGADDDDRPGRGRARPTLAQFTHRNGHVLSSTAVRPSFLCE